MKFFSFNKSQAAVLTTILILIFFGAAYFFIYLPNNEKRMQEQHFRALQNIDRNIHTKINNSVALLRNLLNVYVEDPSKWDHYIQSVNNSRASFSFIKPSIGKISQPGASKVSTAGKDGFDSSNAARENNASGQVNAASFKKVQGFKNELDSGYTINVNNNNREIDLFFYKLMPDSVIYKIGMKFSFEQFIKSLLPGDVFDDYIIFSKGKPVYQSFPSGISYAKEDSLLGFKNGIGSSGIRNLVISGLDYKIFLQPVGFDANNEWVIGGLLTGKHFQKERTQLPTQLILLLLTIMFISMVGFPWLKIYQMGSKDRLTISDGVASIFISMLLVSLIFFTFFNYNAPVRPNSKKDTKAILLNGINKSFKEEIDTAYSKLKQLDALKGTSQEDLKNINDAVKNNIYGRLAYFESIRKVISGLNINQVFWVDKNGNELTNWTVDSLNGPHGNYSIRKYFKGINDNKGYLLNNNDTFYLDQGISWTTNAFRSVISMKSNLSKKDSTVVAAMSFNFKSLDNVILPTGYLFAIVNDSGQVLYHSDPARNLNENLFDVFSSGDKLKTFLTARAAGMFSTKYYGNNYDVKLAPVNGLPYFIVIMEDAVYKETKDMEVYSFTFSMLLLFFGFIVLQLFAIFLVSVKRSFLKMQLFETSWIGPRTSNHREYLLSSIFNFIIIFLLILFFNRCSFLQYLFMLLFSVTIVPFFQSRILEKKYEGDKELHFDNMVKYFAWGVAGIVGVFTFNEPNPVYFRLFVIIAGFSLATSLLKKRTEKKDSKILRFKRLTKYCLYGFMVIIGIVAFKMLYYWHFIYLTLFALLVISLGAGVFFTKDHIFKTVKNLKTSDRTKIVFGKWNYVNSFALMALTRLIITSGLPVVFFYINAANYEQNLAVRYKQVDFTKRLLNKIPADKLAGSKSDYGSGVYDDNSVIAHEAIVKKDAASIADLVKPYSKEDGFAIQLLKKFRLYITDKAIIEDQFDSRSITDSAVLFNHLLDDVSRSETGNILYYRTTMPGKYLEIGADNMNYKFPRVLTKDSKDLYNGLLFWLLLIATLIIFYFVIFNIIKKLFSLNLPDLDIWKKLDDRILISKTHAQPLFLIGVPGSGKKNYLLDKIKRGEIQLEDGTPLVYDEKSEQKNNVFIAELINIPCTGNEDEGKIIWEKYSKKVFEEKNRVIIINHFEYNIQDPLSNRYKLEFLETLFLNSKVRIFILSTIHPVAFLDSAMEISAKGDGKEGTASQELERWHVLLGHYRIIILPLQIPFIAHDWEFMGRVIDDLDGEGIPDVSIEILNAKSNVRTVTLEDGYFVLSKNDKLELPFSLKASLRGYSSSEKVINTKEDLLNIKLAPDTSDYSSARFVREETGQTYFLKNLQTPVYEVGENISEEIRIAKSDELAFKLQVSSHYFYMHIWQSLTKEEKFLLYDLAEDSLVNSYDSYNLSMLIAKGVVIRPYGTLKLFNKGFRNFILTSIGNSEALKIKNRIKENGNWNTLKNPLQLVVLAILAFLLTSQEEAFAKLITYVAALGAAVPAVLKLLSLFGKNPSQKPEGT